jgi:hypothetical protein
MLAHHLLPFKVPSVRGEYFLLFFVNPFRPPFVFPYKYTQPEAVQMKKKTFIAAVTRYKPASPLRARNCGRAIQNRKVRDLRVVAGQPAGLPV